MTTVATSEDLSAEPVSGLNLKRGQQSAKDGRRKPRIVPDRRLYRRVPIQIFGRFMREDRQEFPCRVINMSAGGMALMSPVPCDEGERVVAYLDNLGRIEGVVSRCFESGFAVRISASRFRREKIANLLTWLVNQDSLGLSDSRRYDRTVPRSPDSKIILPNGESFSCRVIDVSLSGASIEVSPKPALGTLVVLGRMRGRVVRHHDRGVAIQFADVQDPDSIAQSFG